MNELDFNQTREKLQREYDQKQCGVSTEGHDYVDITPPNTHFSSNDYYVFNCCKCGYESDYNFIWTNPTLDFTITPTLYNITAGTINGTIDLTHYNNPS